ncbi:MAG: tetratricopeptide repeat protein, partial [Candidatus Eremiobacterota bacterium]
MKFKKITAIFISLLILFFNSSCDSVEGQIKNGHRYLSEKQYDKAGECFDKALKMNPKSSNGWYGKGLFQYTGQKYDEALESFSKSIEYDEKNIKPWNGKIMVYQVKSLLTPEKEKEYYEEMIKCFDEIIKIDGKNIAAITGKGNVFCSMGKYEEALKCYDEALGIDSKKVDLIAGK